jgi:predicted permease
MNYVGTIINQVIIMFILSAVGYVMFRTKKITQEGSKSLGNILIYLSLPCVIINGFLVERTPERILGLGVSALCAALALAAAMLLARLFLGRNAIENFAASFSNPGFFGIPLIVASLSDGAVFYVAAFIAFLNMLQWTYGVYLLERDAPGGYQGSGVASLLGRLIKAPFMIAILIGLFFFLTGLSMPTLPGKCVTYIAGLNTPIAMFTIGIYLAQTDMKKMFFKPRLYLVSFVRMVAAPFAAILLLLLVPNTMADLKIAVLIAAACPVGSNVAVYAQLHHSDYGYAVETVVVSTLLSIITIPLMVTLGTAIWGM